MMVRVSSRWFEAAADYQKYVDKKKSRGEKPLSKDDWEIYVNPKGDKAVKEREKNFQKDPPKKPKSMTPGQSEEPADKKDPSEPPAPQEEAPKEPSESPEAAPDKEKAKAPKTKVKAPKVDVPPAALPSDEVVNFADKDSATGQVIHTVKELGQGGEVDPVAVQALKDLTDKATPELERAREKPGLAKPTLNMIEKTNETLSEIKTWLSQNEEVVNILLHEDKSKGKDDSEDLSLNAPDADTGKKEDKGNGKKKEDKGKGKPKPQPATTPNAPPDTTAKPLVAPDKVFRKFKVTDSDKALVKEVNTGTAKSGQPLSEAEKMQRFKAKATPEMRERMKGMTKDEFRAMLAAMGEDEDTQGKTAHLREIVVRVAYGNPTLRALFLPLLARDGGR
jgi:hypothetical protein